jgi:hypothetical protein
MFLTIRSSSDKTPLELTSGANLLWHSLSHCLPASLRAESLLLKPEDSSPPVYDSYRWFRRYQSTLPPVHGFGSLFSTAVIAVILSTNVYVVITGILMLFLTDCKPSQ